MDTSHKGIKAYKGVWDQLKKLQAKYIKEYNYAQKANKERYEKKQ